MSRNIEPKMVDWLRKKLDPMGLFHHALAVKDPRTIFLLANMACVGIRETSDNAGPMVELIQETIHGANKEAWCMSAQQTNIAFAEELTGIRSLVYPSEHCLTVWRKSPVEIRVKSIPLPGALTIWRHGSTDAGHTGGTGTFDVKRSRFESYEGNTTKGQEGGKIVREGGGFYFNIRNKAGDGTMRLVGWLKPFPTLGV